MPKIHSLRHTALDAVSTRLNRARRDGMIPIIFDAWTPYQIQGDGTCVGKHLTRPQRTLHQAGANDEQS